MTVVCPSTSARCLHLVVMEFSTLSIRLQVFLMIFYKLVEPNVGQFIYNFYMIITNNIEWQSHEFLKIYINFAQSRLQRSLGIYNCSVSETTKYAYLQIQAGNALVVFNARWCSSISTVNTLCVNLRHKICLASGSLGHHSWESPSPAIFRSPNYSQITPPIIRKHTDMANFITLKLLIM